MVCAPSHCAICSIGGAPQPRHQLKRPSSHQRTGALISGMRSHANLTAAERHNPSIRVVLSHACLPIWNSTGAGRVESAKTFSRNVIITDCIAGLESTSQSSVAQGPIGNWYTSRKILAACDWSKPYRRTKTNFRSRNSAEQLSDHYWSWP